MKTIEDYDETYRRCWTIYEAFRRFGFSSNQIVGMYFDNNKLALKLSANDKEFIAVAGDVFDDHETVYRIWQEIGAMIMDKNVPNESFHKTWAELEKLKSLASALIIKGIALPKFTN